MVVRPYKLTGLELFRQVINYVCIFRVHHRCDTKSLRCPKYIEDLVVTQSSCGVRHEDLDTGQPMFTDESRKVLLKNCLGRICYDDMERVVGICSIFRQSVVLFDHRPQAVIVAILHRKADDGCSATSDSASRPSLVVVSREVVFFGDVAIGRACGVFLTWTWIVELRQVAMRVDAPRRDKCSFSIDFLGAC